MRNGPSDEIRAAAKKARLDKKDLRVAELRRLLAEAVAQQEAGSIDLQTFDLASIYRTAGIPKATFYRLRKNDETIEAHCKSLGFSAADDRGREPATSDARASPTEAAPDEHAETSDNSILVVQLMEQVATAKAYIGMLELERRADKKTIRAKTGGMKALDNRIAMLSRYAEALRQQLVDNGIEAVAPTSAPPANGNRRLRIVSDGPEKPSKEH